VTISARPIISLEQTLKAILPEGKFDGRLPPVESWNPPGCGDIGMEIRADGSWWHEGVRITRPRMVALFARILRKDADGTTYLVTPYEKVIVHVAEAHFRAVRVDRLGAPGPGQTLAFVTNLGDIVLAGPAAPLRVVLNPETGEPAPFVHVRGRLEAKMTRPVFYELADMAVPADGAPETLGVWSQGDFYPLGPAA
jgi:uncharacterized protein